MIGASLYIIGCSAKNRVRMRLRRLREPRYLIGAIVGAAYLYFSVFARMGRRGPRAGGPRGGPSPAALEALRSGAPAAVGLALLAATAVGWLLPFDSGLLDFSQAEVQFLFPAPVSRRSLLLHRMMRSQIGILLGSIIPALMVQSFSGYARLRLSVATWLILSTAKVYATGVSLARTRLTSSDTRARRVAWLPLVVLGSACGIVAIALLQTFRASPPDGAREAIVQIGTIVSHGLPRIVLWPFVALAAPLFAPWPGEYLVAMLEAAIVAAACVAWVLASDATFQDAAEEVAARKAQQPGPRAVKYRARTTGWNLAPSGRAEVAFAWKAAMQTLRVVDIRSFVRVAAILVLITVGSTAFGRASGLPAIVGIFALAGAGFTVLMAPQILRVDLRQDLKHLELLKTWPVKASAVVRGEIAWPGGLLTVVAWILIGIALVLSSANFSRVPIGLRLGAAGAAALVAPALVFAQLTIHNGVALMFPAWVPLGSQRARGLDAMGQRIIILGGTWLLLAIMTLPGALAGAIVWFAFRAIVGPLALIPGAIACAVVLGIEVLVATEALGPLYERLDVLSVERTE
jgi:ABC-2 type transport system permease protein